MPAKAPAPPFPKTALNPLPPFSVGCEKIREAAQALWDRGLWAEALAELRRNERDHAGGPALAPLRRDAELALGLSNGDETWRPRGLLTGILLVSGCLLIGLLLALVSIKKQVTPLRAWCYKVIGKFKKPARTFVVLVAFFAVLTFFSLWGLGFSPAHSALARKSEFFRVPGTEGAPAFRVEEGQRVLVRFIRGDWAYGEIPGAGTKAGWVKTEALVFY
jgi:hypothetical protein